MLLILFVQKSLKIYNKFNENSIYKYNAYNHVSYTSIQSHNLSTYK